MDFICLLVTQGLFPYLPLSFCDIYLVPKLSINLHSVEQLYELGFEVNFTNCGCDMQDPWISQLLKMGYKVGCLFDLTSLNLASHLSSSFATVTISPNLWH